MVQPRSRVRNFASRPCQSIPRASGTFRLATPIFLAVALAWSLGVSAALAEGPLGQGEASSVVPTATSGEDGLYITLGSDAFETLLGERWADAASPFERIAETHGVVLTRVRKQDVDRIAALIHEAHHRCAGFVAHPDLDDAHRALEIVARDAAEAHLPKRGEVPYLLDQPDLVNAVLAELDPANILDTIDHLSNDFPNRYYLHPSGVAAAEWIRDLWQGYVTAAGRTDITVELVSHANWPQPSVVATIPGSLLPDQIVVLGGHLDSTRFFGTGNPEFEAPGADDNASGIATLSEALRAALEVDFRPQRTVKIMGYAAEEAGLLGSAEIALRHRSQALQVVGVLQLDMTAFHGSVEDMAFLGDFTNSVLTQFAADLVDTYQPELEWTSTLCGYGCSDHASWHREGFPAVMPSEAIFGEHNSALHSTSDTLATFGNTADHAIKFARLAASFMVELGVDANPALFGDDFETGLLDAWASNSGD